MLNLMIYLYMQELKTIFMTRNITNTSQSNSREVQYSSNLTERVPPRY